VNPSARVSAGIRFPAGNRTAPSWTSPSAGMLSCAIGLAAQLTCDVLATSYRDARG
jgi:hypothetical protein